MIWQTACLQAVKTSRNFTLRGYDWNYFKYDGKISAKFLFGVYIFERKTFLKNILKTHLKLPTTTCKCYISQLFSSSTIFNQIFVISSIIVDKKMNKFGLKKWKYFKRCTVVQKTVVTKSELSKQSVRTVNNKIKSDNSDLSELSFIHDFFNAMSIHFIYF